MLMGTSSCAESRTVAETGDTLMQVIERRRSIRRYTGEKISRQVLEQIVRAGAFAPSSYGQNPVEFVVVEDKDKLKSVAQAKRIGACWNQIRDRDGQRLSVSDEIKDLLDIPSRYEVLCVVTIGHPAESKPPRSEQEMNVQGRTHFGKF